MAEAKRSMDDSHPYFKALASPTNPDKSRPCQKTQAPATYSSDLLFLNLRDSEVFRITACACYFTAKNAAAALASAHDNTTKVGKNVETEKREGQEIYCRTWKLVSIDLCQEMWPYVKFFISFPIFTFSIMI